MGYPSKLHWLAVLEDKLKSAEHILLELENICNKAYFLFLQYALNYFNTINAIFQSKRPLIHQLHTESRKIFFKLGQNFIKPNKLNINIDDENLLALDKIFLGTHCNSLLNLIPNSEASRIRLDCRNFYIVALEEIQDRLPVADNSLFKHAQFLRPEFALNIENRDCRIY